MRIELDVYTTEVTYQHWLGCKTLRENHHTLQAAKESAVSDLLYHLERMEATYTINILLNGEYYQYLSWSDDGWRVLFMRWEDYVYG